MFKKRFIKSISSWLAHPTIFRWAVALAILLTLPSLWNGLAVDDYVHWIVLKGYPHPLSASPLNLFAFISGDPSRARELMDVGGLPWWATEGLKLSFWRPVSSFTHYLDHLFWPDSSWLMHAQNLFWYAALVAVASTLYRRLLQPLWIAGLASVLYAIDDAHGMPVGWLANRNALIATTFGFLALWIHDRWRRENWRPGAILGPFFLAIGLLSAEAALATGAYLLAHALFLDQGKWHTRLARLIPYAVVTGAWRLLYQILGYGAWGSGMYLDPLREPRLFVMAFLERAPVLLLGQLGVPPSEVWIFLSDSGRRLLVLGSLVFLTLVGWILIPLLQRNPIARFWVSGALLSVIPICATFPADRLLFFVGLGAMGLIAQYIGTATVGSDERGMMNNELRKSGLLFIIPRSAFIVLAVAWILIHGVLAPILLPLRSMAPVNMNRALERVLDRLPSDPAIAQQTLVIAHTPDQFFTEYLSSLRVFQGKSFPFHIWTLSAGLTPAEVWRTDAQTLVIRPQGGYITNVMDPLFRGKEHHVAPGYTVHLTGLTVEVTTVTKDGRPAEATFRFAIPLEDASLRWVAWQESGFTAFDLPVVGERVVLPGADMSILF